MTKMCTDRTFGLCIDSCLFFAITFSVTGAAQNSLDCVWEIVMKSDLLFSDVIKTLYLKEEQIIQDISHIQRNV